MGTNAITELTEDLDWDDDDGYMTCECELDWNCGLHAGGPTYIERRFQGLDDDEMVG